MDVQVKPIPILIPFNVQSQVQHATIPQHYIKNAYYITPHKRDLPLPTTNNYVHARERKEVKTNHFKCPHCVVESQLSKKRQRQTTGARSQCKDFDTLINHILTFHFDDYEKMKTLDKTNRYKCFEPFCGWFFRDIKDLVEHTIMNHPETFGLRYESITDDIGITQEEITTLHNGRLIQTVIVPIQLGEFYQNNKEKT